MISQVLWIKTNMIKYNRNMCMALEAFNKYLLAKQDSTRPYKKQVAKLG